MPEFLERIVDELDDRLAELSEELDRLQTARAALSADRSSAETAPPRRPRSAQPDPPRRTSGSKAAGSRKRAPRGENRTKILSLVTERPGVSAGEVAGATGIKRAVTYNTLSKLMSDGLIQKVEIGSTVGYRSATAATEPVDGD